MSTHSRKTQPRTRRAWTMGKCAKSIALVLLLLCVRTPALSADSTPTNKMPVQILEILRQAGELPVGHKGREAFLTEKFSAMGSEGIEFLIRELKKPARKIGPRGGEMRVATFASMACEIYAGLDRNAYDRLKEELQKDSSPVFWENACYIYACSDHDDSFDVLAGWVTESGVDAKAKSQISADAYSRLGVKLRRNHLPFPPFTEMDNDFGVKFRQWWQSNRQTVLQQYLEKKKAPSQDTKAPNQ